MKKLFFVLMTALAIGMQISSWVSMGSEHVVPGLFLYHDSSSEMFQQLDLIGIFCFFAILLFGYFFISCFMFGITAQYRTMILQRYPSKTRYLLVQLRKGFVSVALLIGILVALFLLFCGIKGLDLSQLPSKDIVFLLLESLNLFLFFAVCVSCNLILTIKKGEISSMTIILIGTCILLLLDITLPFLSILTYGDTSSQCLGIVIQLVALASTISAVFVSLKKSDV